MVKETILNTIKKYNLIEPNDTIIVAVSGGPDSMCLLDNLIELKQELQIKKIVVAHLNHMIREEAKSETVYVQEYCKNKEIECYVKFVDILKKSTERLVQKNVEDVKDMLFLMKYQKRLVQIKLQLPIILTTMQKQY